MKHVFSLRLLGVLSSIFLAIFACIELGFSWSTFSRFSFDVQDLWSFSSKELTPLFWQNIAIAFYETFLMAYLGTFIGVLLGIPLVFCASRPVSGKWTRFTLCSFFSLLRATPALFWAVIAVVFVGLGPTAGTLALTIVTLGYFGKLASDELDQISSSKADALRATGASRLALVRFVYWPIIKPKFLIMALFMFEYNIRHSSILGLVGAGGIGYYIAIYLKWLEYEIVILLIALIFVVVILIEAIASAVKKHFA